MKSGGAWASGRYPDESSLLPYLARDTIFLEIIHLNIPSPALQELSSTSQGLRSGGYIT
jgi:hypothetical protein